MTNTVNVGLMLIQLSFYSHFYLPSPVIAPYLINMHVMQTFKETIYFNFFTIISILVLVDEPEPFVKVFLVRVFFCGLSSPSGEPHLYRGVNIKLSISNTQSTPTCILG